MYLFIYLCIAQCSYSIIWSLIKNTLLLKMTLVTSGVQWVMSWRSLYLYDNIIFFILFTGNYQPFSKPFFLIWTFNVSQEFFNIFETEPWSFLINSYFSDRNVVFQ